MKQLKLLPSEPLGRRVKTIGTQAKRKGPKVCEKCGKRGEVIETDTRSDRWVRRRYQCVCGDRWTTYEVMEKYMEMEDEA